MDFKVGDKLICNFTFHFGCISYIKNKEYTIGVIDYSDNGIFIPQHNSMDGIWFYENGNIRYKIKDFFYTQDKLRSLKLESL